MSLLSSWFGKRQSLYLIHYLNTLSQLLGCFGSCIHLYDVFVHFVEVSIDEMVDDLGRQVHPYVKDPVLALVTECILQVLLYIRHDHMSPPKIHRVPLAVSLPF